MNLLASPWGLPIAGLIAGAAMGYAARAHHFCTMAALERHWYASDARGIRAWALAAAVALVGTQLLAALGFATPAASFYLAPTLPIAGSIVGGLMFGVGMALVGTCGFGAIVRLGGGNLRALVVLTGIALAAIAAQRGITGHIRTAIIDPVALDLGWADNQSIGALVRASLGADPTLPLALIFASVALWWIFADPAFRRDHGKIAAGTVIGLAIAAGWAVTSHYAGVLFRPVQIEAGSYVAPVGETVMQIITVTGELPDYGVGLMVGTFVGAAVAAWRNDDMRWEACDDARELGRHLAGAFLMGTGGIFAMGCTIGQGVTAVSAMAVSAPLVIASIALGARMGLGYLVEGDPIGFLRRGHRMPAE
jgi:uncharacterized membrane protein YedE/YeeE